MTGSRHDETTHNAQYTRKYELLSLYRMHQTTKRNEKTRQKGWSLFVVRTYGNDISTRSYANLWDCSYDRVHV